MTLQRIQSELYLARSAYYGGFWLPGDWVPGIAPSHYWRCVIIAEWTVGAQS